jgi:hypothetical protein
LSSSLSRVPPASAMTKHLVAKSKPPKQGGDIL